MRMTLNFYLKIVRKNTMNLFVIYIQTYMIAKFKKHEV